MVTPEQYIKQLEKSKNLAIDRFGNLTSLEKDVIDSSFSWLVSNLDIKSGDFIVTDDLTVLMNNFLNAVINIIHNNANYQQSLSKYLYDLRIIGNNTNQFQTEFNNIDWNKANIPDVQKALINETIDQFTENGLNEGFARPLRDLMFRNVVAGLSVKEAKNILSDYIFSGNDETGKLSKYLTQTAQQGVDSYTGAINTKLQQTFTFTGLFISGSLIETSSAQCIMAVEMSKSSGGYLTNSQWKQVLQVAKDNKKARLIEGTTLQNLPINKLHWGCRHEFTPSIKD